MSGFHDDSVRVAREARLVEAYEPFFHAGEDGSVPDLPWAVYDADCVIMARCPSQDVALFIRDALNALEDP